MALMQVSGWSESVGQTPATSLVASDASSGNAIGAVGDIRKPLPENAE
jgi:hypothetical protein